jgi:TetR/AcrR family fatty acid metabolism transcriptional regulator
MVTQREHTEVRQKQIISAARRLIVKYGSEHVTVRRMAREIGVSEAAIYRHFKSKSDVLSFMVEDIESTLLEDIQPNPDNTLNSINILEQTITNHISAIEQKKGVAFQVIAEIISLGDKKLNKKIRGVIDNYLDHIKTLLNNGIKEGVIRPDIDIDSAAVMFFSLTQGLVNIWALSQYDFNLLERFGPLWDVYLHSVATAKPH